MVEVSAPVPTPASVSSATRESAASYVPTDSSGFLTAFRREMPTNRVVTACGSRTSVSARWALEESFVN